MILWFVCFCFCLLYLHLRAMQWTGSTTLIFNKFLTNIFRKLFLRWRTKSKCITVVVAVFGAADCAVCCKRIHNGKIFDALARSLFTFGRSVACVCMCDYKTAAVSFGLIKTVIKYKINYLTLIFDFSKIFIILLLFLFLFFYCSTYLFVLCKFFTIATIKLLLCSTVFISRCLQLAIKCMQCPVRTWLMHCVYIHKYVEQ